MPSLRSSHQHLAALLASSLALASVGCRAGGDSNDGDPSSRLRDASADGADRTDAADVESADARDEEKTLEIATSEPRGEGKRALQIETGETRRTRQPESREALLTILKGQIGGRGTRSVELVRTVKGDLYRDRDPTPGSEQWNTRAKIVDAEGNVLWRDRIYSMFKLLAFLQTSLADVYDIELGAQEIIGFAEGSFPRLLEFAVHVPLGIEGGEEYVLEWQNEEGEYQELGRFDIDALVEQAQPPRFDGTIETLSKTGPPSERIDVAILADGYTSEDRGAFAEDARQVLEHFRETHPFSDYMDRFNFRTVWTPSASRRAGYDCTDFDRLVGNDCEKLRDTFYRFTFIVDALIDKYGFDAPSSASRVALPLRIARMHEVATLATYDEIILLSNSDRRSGFAGMYTSVLTTFDDGAKFPHVAVHEFGHSFGLLGDEYYIPGDPCLYDPDLSLPPNISQTHEYDELKWNEWVESTTPLPTPPAKRKQYDVGAYKRAYNCDDLYRPSFMCKMHDSDGEFCSVCREQLVRRTYDYLDFVASGSPNVTRTDDHTLRFETAFGSGPARGRIVWRLDGEKVGRGNTLTLATDAVGSEWTKLEAEMSLESPYVRETDEELRRTFEWWVRAQ